LALSRQGNIFFPNESLIDPNSLVNAAYLNFKQLVCTLPNAPEWFIGQIFFDEDLALGNEFFEVLQAVIVLLFHNRECF
jgi:hypothetical protein